MFRLLLGFAGTSKEEALGVEVVGWSKRFSVGVAFGPSSVEGIFLITARVPEVFERGRLLCGAFR